MSPQCLRKLKARTQGLKRDSHKDEGYLNQRAVHFKQGAIHLTRGTLFVSPPFRRAWLFVVGEDVARRILDGYTCISLPIYYYPLKRKQYGKTLDRSHIIVVSVSRVPTSQLLPTNTITYV